MKLKLGWTRGASLTKMWEPHYCSQARGWPGSHMDTAEAGTLYPSNARVKATVYRRKPEINRTRLGMCCCGLTLLRSQSPSSTGGPGKPSMRYTRGLPDINFEFRNLCLKFNHNDILQYALYIEVSSCYTYKALSSCFHTLSSSHILYNCAD